MKPDARAVRERKQKIFVVVGGLLLLAMLAFQLPKLLGGSSSSETSASLESTTVPAEPGGVVAGAAPVAVIGSTSTVSATGKLRSFTMFAAKDPFAQQVVTETAVADEGGGAVGSDAKAGTPTTTTFTTGKTAAAAAATIVTVNGVRQVLEPGTKFPSSDPLFVLVAEKPDSKSVVIAVAGGAYAGGNKTTTLKAGKPLTLVNTATGARYKISLVSVGTGDDVAKPAATPAAP